MTGRRILFVLAAVAAFPLAEATDDNSATMMAPYEHAFVNGPSIICREGVAGSNVGGCVSGGHADESSGQIAVFAVVGPTLPAQSGSNHDVTAGITAYHDLPVDAASIRYEFEYTIDHAETRVVADGAARLIIESRADPHGCFCVSIVKETILQGNGDTRNEARTAVVVVEPSLDGYPIGRDPVWLVLMPWARVEGGEAGAGSASVVVTLDRITATWVPWDDAATGCEAGEPRGPSGKCPPGHEKPRGSKP